MTAYQDEQRQGHLQVIAHLRCEGPALREALWNACAAYLAFRRKLDGFLLRHCTPLCTANCYTSQTSACCNRESIITFFADLVVNALVSGPQELDRLLEPLERPHEGAKCVYLDGEGCIWRLKPIVCAMFLCDRAEQKVLGNTGRVRDQWLALKAEDRLFRWPDRPVLFDWLEERFMAAGIQSPLMYLHLSPGLLRVKRRAGWSAAPSQPREPGSAGRGGRFEGRDRHRRSTS
jgi:hypothetical protein